MVQTYNTLLSAAAAGLSAVMNAAIVALAREEETQ